MSKNAIFLWSKGLSIAQQQQQVVCCPTIPWQNIVVVVVVVDFPKMVRGKTTKNKAPAAAASKDISSPDEKQSDAEGASTAAAPEPAHGDLDDELSPSKVLVFESGDECDGLNLEEKEAYRKAAGVN